MTSNLISLCKLQVFGPQLAEPSNGLIIEVRYKILITAERYPMRFIFTLYVVMQTHFALLFVFRIIISDVSEDIINEHIIE